MRKPVLLKMFFAFFVILLASCEAEPVDSAVLDNVAPEVPGDDDDDDNPDPGTSEGDYWPMALNNEWVFDSNAEDVSPMKIIGTETIGGLAYYKINYAFQDSGTDDLTGTSTIYLRKEGGAYYQRVETYMPDENGMSVTVSPYELTILMDNLAVGQTWTDATSFETTYEMEGFPIEIPDITTNIDIEGTVLEKGISLAVNGTTYNDVIKVKVIQTVEMQLPGSNQTTSTVATTNMWFAKDVGPIKSESSAMGESYTLTLTSYTVN